MKDLKKYGENLGLTENELTPLLQETRKVQGLSKLAKPTKKTEELFASIDKKLGGGYDAIKKQASQLPQAEAPIVRKLVDRFQKFQDRLELSDFPSSDKLKVIKKVENAAEKMAARGITAEGIMSSYHDVNKAVDWKSVKGGKKELAAIQKMYKDALKDINPEVASNFNKMNKLWSNYEKIKESIGLNKYKKYFEYGKYGALLSFLAKNVVTADVEGIATTLGTYLGGELARNVTTKMLTDPKYQNLLIRSANAVKNTSRSLGLKTMKDLADQISKDFPDLAKDVDWEEFQKDNVLSTRKSK